MINITCFFLITRISFTILSSGFVSQTRNNKWVTNFVTHELGSKCVWLAHVLINNYWVYKFNNYLNSTQWQPRGRGRRVLCSVDPDLDLWKILNIKVMYIDLHKIYSYYHFNFLKTYLVEDTQKRFLRTYSQDTCLI